VTAESKEQEANIESAMNAAEMQKLTPELMSLPGMREAILRKAGILKDEEEVVDTGSKPMQMGPSHYLQELEINDYPREARWKVTQKETTSRLQFEFQTAVTLKGSYFGPGRPLGEGDRKLYLHLEAKTEQILKNCVLEIRRLLNEETLRVSARQTPGGGGGASSHRYSVLS
jgi:ATP-dependent RNA helicase DDX46/PRP5